MKYFFRLIALIFLLSVHNANGSENPYLKFDGKTYSDYCELLHEDYFWMAYDDTAEQRLENVRQAAKHFGGREWALEAEMVEYNYKFCNSFKAGFPDGSYTSKDFINDLTKIEKKATRLPRPYLQLRAMFRIMEIYDKDIKNYELAFQYALRIDKLLDKVAIDEFPRKPYYYIHIANLYLFFREFDSAAKYFEKIIQTPQASYKANVLEAAYNGLGLIWRDRYKDFERSDSYFNSILDVEAQPDVDKDALIRHSIWQGVATGNLGYNAYLQEDYDKAVPMLEFSMQRMAGHEDYNYASGKAATLADIYIEKNDLRKAKQYIDLACGYIDKTDPILCSSYPYSLLSRYFAAKGDYKQAMIYADSAAVEKERHNEEFNALKLYRADQRAKLEELEFERLRSEGYRMRAAMLFTVLLLVSLFSGLVYYLYRRKQAAYRELVRKNQQWAKVGRAALFPDDDDMEPEDPAQPLYATDVNGTQAPEPDDIILMGKITELMTGSKIYTDSELTIDSLADAAGAKRHQVSRAVNRCTRSNFNSYVNEYRVKEAVRLLSDSGAKRLSIDGIALSAGFNDRKTFYKVFKRATGLSPSAFRDNATKE